MDKETKERIEKEAYKFAESILGEPPVSSDDTIVTGYIAGRKRADQELAACKDALEIHELALQKCIDFLNGSSHWTTEKVYDMLIKVRDEPEAAKSLLKD